MEVDFCSFVAYSNVLSQTLKIQGGDAKLLVQILVMAVLKRKNH